MPDRSKFEELWKRMLPVYQALGPLKNRAVTVCEDNVQYPLEKVVEIANLYNVITRKPFDGDTQAQVAKLGELLDALQPVENAQPRTYLWAEGNMPTETEYTDNSGMRYNHEPDFRPYLYEMLLPEDVAPKGAVVICAGGDHGESVVKGTQVAKDLNAPTRTHGPRKRLVWTLPGQCAWCGRMRRNTASIPGKWPLPGFPTAASPGRG